MTGTAIQISETPMAPYIEILRNMKPQEIRIVVSFLQDALKEMENRKVGASEIIKNKYKRLSISQETKDFVRDFSLSAEEMDDERTKYILGYK